MAGLFTGAGSTAYYNFKTPEDHVTPGIILYCSSATGATPSDDPTGSNFTSLAAKFGCGNLSAGSELTCMKRVDYMELEVFLDSYIDNGTSPEIRFTLVIDPVTRLASYAARELAGKISKMDRLLHSSQQREIIS
ncbi:uncharacterized protein RSE6_08323 [Rhynchosporium secalis]|uniref:Uncharacterized protein n=1 Tax=Rhynchosporium secalis TaxID=38038 RepID=A0A1E1MFB5_RHYSE|nr:uncharacterized protein RSE6_08323 [Rhynchosporium secalis]